MISSTIIIFREVLEAAIVIGFLFASTMVAPQNRKAIWLGVGLGVCGATFFAYFMAELESSFDNEGEFLFNAVILLLASLLITWSIVWMRNQKEGQVHIKKIGEAVASGATSPIALTIIALSVVMREGSEAVFFLLGLSETIGANSFSLLAGGLLGLVLGFAVAYIIYKGMIRIPLRYLFQTISLFLMLIAAGMASEAAANLILIDKLPTLIDTVWDSSFLLSEQSIIGHFFHVLIGYDDAPSAMQVLFFTASICLTLIASYSTQKQHQLKKATTDPQKG